MNATTNANVKPSYTDTAAGALALINDLVDERIVRKVNDALDAGDLRLIPDPQVPGVWGVQHASSGQMEAVLYLEAEDFEGFEGFMG